MTALRAAEYVPRIVVGLVAGVWIDRLPRRPVLIATNASRALLLLGVAASTAAGLVRIELLYVVGILMAALGVVFGIWHSATGLRAVAGTAAIARRC